ncbi:uncharacterized protein [Procambarus clarkii]|uniref:uncharacterized protein isoform X2 n=1 Tax=Procambarus clarkii TaxID=6728 RepID=UPI003744711E
MSMEIAKVTEQPAEPQTPTPTERKTERKKLKGKERERNIDSQLRICTYETYERFRRHYFCGQHEYCCSLGCCVSTAFSFYQLWYFWLLLLLIILLCSGGGWWFRWRHGGFSNQNTPTSLLARRQRRIRTHGHNAINVYPHPHTFYGGRVAGQHEYHLPPGYDKDPPSYNEVINHLSLFPRADAVRREAGDQSGGGGGAGHSSFDECHLSLPPPSYEMVLDLKRREMQFQREMGDEEEQTPRVHSARSRIRRLLGKMRTLGNNQNDSPALDDFTPPEDSYSSAVPPAGLFTISRESLPSQEFYLQPSTSSGPSNSSGPSESSHLTSDSDTSSHSDFSVQSFILNPSPSRRSMESSPAHLQEYIPSAPSAIQVLTPAHHYPEYISSASSAMQVAIPMPQEPEIAEEFEPLEHAGTNRPCTGRSVLSRPTTSISTRTLTPPREVVRKTSLPGTVLEAEEEIRSDR